MSPTETNTQLMHHSESAIESTGMLDDPTLDSIMSAQSENQGYTHYRRKLLTKKPMDPNLLTPEYIEEQRRLRNLRKEQERKEKEALGLLPKQEEAKDPFIKRPLLEVAKADPKDGPIIRIMSYNILAQTLIRRELFPTNGKILKWSIRSQVLLAEIKHYNADILCLQELDRLQFKTFWVAEFEKLGYTTKFYRFNTKNHGVAIVFKSELFNCKHQSFIKYDQDIMYDEHERNLPGARIATNNVGFMAYLEFQPKLIKQFPHLSQRNGIIMGNTHLFWHPFGTFERCRQTYMILHKYKEFAKVLSIILGNSKGFYSFFAGDMNSEPFDAPYLSITSKPITYKGQTKNVLGCSLSYTYSKVRALEDGHEAKLSRESSKNSTNSNNDHEDEDENDDEPEEDERRETVDDAQRNNPTNPEPEEWDITPEQEELISQLEQAHNSLDIRAISLYSAGYKLVDPTNAGINNDRGEPSFSNWVGVWNGLLDYLLVLTKWNADTDDYSNKIDTPEEIVERCDVKLLKLLKMPSPDDMGPQPNGQPRINQFPSDHLCIMAELQLL